jgi:hypothetical protein
MFPSSLYRSSFHVIRNFIIYTTEKALLNNLTNLPATRFANQSLYSNILTRSLWRIICSGFQRNAVTLSLVPTSETSVYTIKTTRRYIPERSHLLTIMMVKVSVYRSRLINICNMCQEKLVVPINTGRYSQTCHSMYGTARHGTARHGTGSVR